MCFVYLEARDRLPSMCLLFHTTPAINVSRAWLGSDRHSLVSCVRKCCACLFWTDSWWLHLLDSISHIRRNHEQHSRPSPSSFTFFLPPALETITFPCWRIITCPADPYLCSSLLSPLNHSLAEIRGLVWTVLKVWKKHGFIQQHSIVLFCSLLCS